MILRILKTIVNQTFQKYRENQGGIPLAAIDRSRNGSGGCAKMAQFLADANAKPERPTGRSRSP